MGKMYDYKPDYATHPGEIVDEYIEQTHCSKEDFAKKIGWSLNILENLVNGKIPITDKMAKELSKATDMSKKFWLNLQENYENIIERLNNQKQLDLNNYKKPISAISSGGTTLLATHKK
jgi:HTH-type transcriptional regulator/antitoxin HigA